CPRPWPPPFPAGKGVRGWPPSSGRTGRAPRVLHGISPTAAELPRDDRRLQRSLVEVEFLTGIVLQLCPTAAPERRPPPAAGATPLSADAAAMLREIPVRRQARLAGRCSPAP